MEVLGDAQLRAAVAAVGGLDEAVREFIRVPHGAKPAEVRGVLRRRYDARELAHAGVPLAAQIMCGCPSTAGDAARLLATTAAAPRVDLNCGCPSRRANSVHNGPATSAGASLLDEPDRLHAIAASMVHAARDSATLVSVKMRTGMRDPGRFDECVCAARDAGVDMIAVHGRTRKQGYTGESDWGTVKRAVELCRDHPIQVVGNGDCVRGADVVRRAAETGCHGVMIGRGAVANCGIFWDARQLFEGGEAARGALSAGAASRERVRRERVFLRAYFAAGAGVPVHLPDDEIAARVRNAVAAWSPKRHRIATSRVKMVVGHAAWASADTRERIRSASCHGDSEAFLNMVLSELDWSVAEGRHAAENSCFAVA